MLALEKELGKELSSSQGSLMFPKKHTHHSLRPILLARMMVENLPVRPDKVTSHKDLPRWLPARLLTFQHWCLA